MKYSVTQSFSTEGDTSYDDNIAKSFSNKKDGLKYFNEVKNNTQQGGCIVTDLWNLKEDDILETHYSNHDYSDDYGKLVISFHHTGKGMGYSHKFLNAFWLYKHNSDLSDNPDSRFKLWQFVLDIVKEDLDGLTYDEAQALVEKEARLRLENSIDLEDLGIIFAEENETEE